MSKFCGPLKPASQIGNKSKNQVRAIFGLAKRKGLDDDELHSFVESKTGISSIRALNRQQADVVIIALGGLAFYQDKEGTPRRTINYRRQKAGVSTMATQSHLELMHSLAAKRGMSLDGLKSLCLRMIKRESPLTTKDTNKIIEAIKAMNKRDYLQREKSEPPASADGSKEDAA